MIDPKKTFTIFVSLAIVSIVLASLVIGASAITKDNLGLSELPSEKTLFLIADYFSVRIGEKIDFIAQFIGEGKRPLVNEPIEFYVDNSYIESKNTSESGLAVFTWDTTGYPEGKHSIISRYFNLSDKTYLNSSVIEIELGDRKENKIEEIKLEDSFKEIEIENLSEEIVPIENNTGSPDFVPENVGSNWETSCIESECQTIVYSYEKYWKNEQGQWEVVDENWFECSNGGNVGNARFCTKNYYFNVQADSQGNIASIVGNSNLTTKLTGFNNAQLAFSPLVNGSVITYRDVIPNYVDIRYQYLPHKLKEEIIIKKKIPSVQSNFNVIFSLTGLANFAIEKPYICDADGDCEYLDYFIEQGNMNLALVASYLNDPATTYPVVIDPTIFLNDTHIAWNGHVNNNSNNYTRYDNPSLMIIAGTSTNHYRAAIDWNVSSILDGSEIKNATLSLYSTAPIFPYNVSLYHMEGANTAYPNVSGDCPNGNCLYYDDMGNGTEYNKTTVNQKNVYRNYTLPNAALSNLQTKLASDIFSIGIVGEGYAGLGTISIGARDYAVVAFRPQLIVIYGVNGTDADAAIEQGIDSSLPNNPISSGQQIYLVNENGQHYLGTFDKSTILSNQTWGFNYVESGASFINMPSLFRVLNVWENETFSFSEIVSQVSVFINATKY